MGSAVVDGLEVEQEAMRPTRVVAVREGHIAETKVRDDAKPTWAHAPNGGSRQGGGKQVTRLQVTADAAVSDVPVEHTEDRIMVVVPATPREVSARELDAKLVADAVLRGAIRDAHPSKRGEGRRRQAKVGGYHLRELGIRDGVLLRRPSGDKL